MVYGAMGELLSQAHTYYAGGVAVAEKPIVVEQGQMPLH